MMIDCSAEHNLDFMHRLCSVAASDKHLPHELHIQRLPTKSKLHSHSNRMPLAELLNHHKCPPASLDFFENMEDDELVSASAFRPSSGTAHISTSSSIDGLGIVSMEDPFTTTVASSTVSHASPYIFGSSTVATPAESEQKLSSPFNEHNYIPDADVLQLHDQSMPYESIAADDTSFQGHGPFYHHDDAYPMYTTASPARGQGNEHGRIGNTVFRRPTVPQIATTSASATPISLHSHYATPTIHASPIYWTPRNTTPMYPEYFGLTPTLGHLPTAMLDYPSPQHDQYMYSMPPTRTIATYPLRRKPHLRPSLSESCVPRLSSPARFRAASTSYCLQPPSLTEAGRGMDHQLPLPALPPSVLVGTPHVPMHDRYVSPSTQRSNKSCRPSSRKRPASPPLSDFSDAHAPYLVPLKQEPSFRGDLYTPKYKRRAPNGRWEGWCRDCVPGRWLDLKNSRYWEDKLRNHGICAKTKIRFAEPDEVRWIRTDGTVVAQNDCDASENEDTKRREGFCNTCKTWVVMDGMRTKAKDRAVGWWMHAYKVSVLTITLHTVANMDDSATTTRNKRTSRFQSMSESFLDQGLRLIGCTTESCMHDSKQKLMASAFANLHGSCLSGSSRCCAKEQVCIRAKR